ncbi:condensation domain-containing protein [Streptomyces sp. NPDC057307]|uniref:condensation domain-containing protein n=1 Tax=Streptomyces sp. NPDC057307 TaxID=3346096 RepID=UPI0036343849
MSKTDLTALSTTATQLVPFAAPAVHTSAVGPLTWGQLCIWDVLRRLPAGDDSLNMAEWRPVVVPLSVSQVAGLLGQLLERHEALRSHYFPDADGEPAQRVLPEGKLDALLVECGPGNPAEWAEDIGRRMRRGAFDEASELPLRVAILTRAGAPVAVVLVISHMAVDRWSMSLLAEELADCLTSGSADTLPPRARQPLERAAFEGSASGIRRERSTLDYWARSLRRTPRALLAATSTPDEAQRDWAAIESPAMARAVRALAARAATTTGMVLIGAVTLLLALRAGTTAGSMRLIVSTRSDPRDRGFVGPINQNALLRLDLEKESFDEWLRRSSAATLLAYRRCEADPRKVEALAAEVAREAGFQADGYCFLNDVRTNESQRPNALEPAGAGSHDDPSGPTRLVRLDLPGRQVGAKFFLYLERLDETCLLKLCKDPEFLGESTALDFLADLERLLIRAAVTPSPRIEELASWLLEPGTATAKGRRGLAGDVPGSDVAHTRE